MANVEAAPAAKLGGRAVRTASSETTGIRAAPPAADAAPGAACAKGPSVAVGYLEVRGLALDVLRRVFLAEPERAFLDACLRSRAFFVFERFDESPACAAGLRDVVAYLDGHDPVSLPGDFDELHADYTRLFVGPRAPEAPLWASYYLEPERLLFQQTTLDVRNRYRRYGLVFDGAPNAEADDHLGLELDFLYRLNARMLSVAKGGEDGPGRAGGEGSGGSVGAERRASFEDLRVGQVEFLEGHLKRFVPAFADAVDARAATAFYRGFARILAGFVEVDARRLKAGLDDGKVR